MSGQRLLAGASLVLVLLSTTPAHADQDAAAVLECQTVGGPNWIVAFFSSTISGLFLAGDDCAEALKAAIKAGLDVADVQTRTRLRRC